jgi:hypothetical protein
MLKRFLPRQENFFNLFQKTADIVVNASSQFHAMLHDLPNQQRYIDSISTLEHAGDEITHTTFELLHKTFITPFDRHDIHHLTSRLDDILDLINRCAQRFPFYQLNNLPEEMFTLAELSTQATLFLKKAVYRLHTLKQAQEIFKFCQDIDYIENQANGILLVAEKNLFLDEKDFKRFFKLKDILSQTKDVISCCQDIGNTIKGIVLEYS